MQIKIAALVSLLPLLAQAMPTAAPPGTRIALTKRSSLTKNGVINFNALHSHVRRVRGKIARGFASYEKNTGRMHPNYRNTTTLGRLATGTVALTDEGETLWQGAVSVGTPPANFTVDFDTGSSDFFLLGPDCVQDRDGRQAYDPSQSSSSQDVGQGFQLAFGDGSTVEGEQFSDTVTLGGLTVTGQHVGAATQYSDGFEAANFPPDGLLGMAFQEISEFNSSPVFQSLVDQKQTDAGVFGFTLLEEGSELFLGGVDTSQFQGDLTQVPLTRKGFWEITLDGASVGDQLVSYQQDAIVDTGTTLLIGDSQSVAKLYAAVPGAQDASNLIGEGFFTFPCDSAPDNVSLTLGGKQFTISADAINVGPLSQGSNDCLGGIIGDDSQGFWILGDVFLRNVYTSFDVDNEQVGFADLV